MFGGFSKFTIIKFNCVRGGGGCTCECECGRGCGGARVRLLVNIQWGGFESRWFCRSGFEFAKTLLSVLNH